MSTEEWERLKETLKKPPTQEARKEAAEAFNRYRIVSLAKGKRSRPVLVSLGYKKPYPTAVPVDKITEELERNPSFYEHLREIIGEEE